MAVARRVVKPAAVPAVRPRPEYLIAFFLLFSVPLFIMHATLLTLPYFWDEQGQFIPTALDLLRHGDWIAHSTLPNVHPPGVEAYLVFWYLIFGYSVAVTRVAMLFVAGAGLLFTFLLSIELSRDSKGSPAFFPPLLLLVSPLFYMQSFMAQLDMPAMVFTLLGLYLFLKRRYAFSAVACVALVLTKETGLVTVVVFAGWLLRNTRKTAAVSSAPPRGQRGSFLDWWRAAAPFALLRNRNIRTAAYFIAPVIALGVWLVALHAATGNWLGNAEFAHYNVGYSLHPVRIALNFLRRFYYLFIAEFRWIGSLILILAGRNLPMFRKTRWKVTMLVAGANIVLVSVLGGAELERYLLPVLPLFYIAVAVTLSSLRKRVGAPALIAMLAGLCFCLFWNPPYPFPYENNWSMVDFVRLQKIAASYSERNLGQATIATAWPYTTALKNPDFGYVRRRLHVIETKDFSESSIAKIDPSLFQYLITYTRTWTPEYGVIRIPLVRRFLTHFYQWHPDITPEQCESLGLFPRMTWTLRGQRITVYARDLR